MRKISLFFLVLAAAVAVAVFASSSSRNAVDAVPSSSSRNAVDAVTSSGSTEAAGFGRNDRGSSSSAVPPFETEEYPSGAYSTAVALYPPPQAAGTRVDLSSIEIDVSAVRQPKLFCILHRGNVLDRIHPDLHEDEQFWRCFCQPCEEEWRVTELGSVGWEYVPKELIAGTDTNALVPVEEVCGDTEMLLQPCLPFLEVRQASSTWTPSGYCCYGYTEMMSRANGRRCLCSLITSSELLGVEIDPSLLINIVESCSANPDQDYGMEKTNGSVQNATAGESCSCMRWGMAFEECDEYLRGVPLASVTDGCCKALKEAYSAEFSDEACLGTILSACSHGIVHCLYEIIQFCKMTDRCNGGGGDGDGKLAIIMCVLQLWIPTWSLFLQVVGVTLLIAIAINIIWLLCTSRVTWGQVVSVGSAMGSAVYLTLSQFCVRRRIDKRDP